MAVRVLISVNKANAKNMVRTSDLVESGTNDTGPGKTPFAVGR